MEIAIVGYWVTTTLAAIAFLLPGIGNLVHAPQIANDMARLGYPSYFLTILGSWKILGAIAITVPRFPRVKEWAYAGMIFDLTGAAISRAVSGDGVAGIAPPLAIAAVVAVSWTLRPRSRRLGLADVPVPRWESFSRMTPAGGSARQA